MTGSTMARSASRTCRTSTSRKPPATTARSGGRDHFDDYDVYMDAGSAGELGKRHGLEQVGFWRKLLEHPSYDAWWQQQAMDKILAAQPLKVPVMVVDSLWDQEDIYGAPAVYKAIKAERYGQRQSISGAGAVAPRAGNSATPAHWARSNSTAIPGFISGENILRPFLDQYLKDGAPKADVAPVTAFETGTNAWRRLTAWPAGCASGCPVHPRPLYLQAGLKLSHSMRRSWRAPSSTNMFPIRRSRCLIAQRPIQPVGYGGRIDMAAVAGGRSARSRPGGPMCLHLPPMC